MSELEIFDIFNEEMIWIGTDSRANAHAKGLWHQTFHCWIVNHSTSVGDSLLFQLRHKDKDTYPGLLDISCAGHLQAGETIEDGVRELKEELGITIPFNELIHCGMVAEENVISEQCVDREFNHLFILECDLPLEEYNYQTSEISQLYLIHLREFQSLIRGEIDSIRTGDRTFHIHDFTPMSSKYAHVLFEHLDRI